MAEPDDGAKSPAAESFRVPVPDFNDSRSDARPDSSSEFQRSIDEQRAAMRAREAEYERSRAEIEPYEKKALADLERPTPPPPQLRDAPAPPRQELAKGAQDWLQTASILGLLAGWHGRTASTNALTAFGGALEGFREGDKAKFDANYKTWQAQNDAVVTHNKQLIDQYNLVLKSEKLTTDQKLNQLKLIASINQDKANEMALRVSGLSEISKNIAQYEYHTAQIEERARNIDRLVEEGKEKAEERRKMRELKERELEQKMALQEKSALSPGAIEFFAEQEASGSHEWKVGIGKGIQGRADLAAVLEKAAQIQRGEGLTGAGAAARSAEYQGTRAAARTSATRREVMEIYSAAADSFFDQALAASNALPRSEYRRMNEAYRAYLNQTGSPELRALGAATNAAINGYAKAIAAGGTATVSDKDHAREVLSDTFSPGDYEAAIRQLKREIAGEKNALEKSAKDFAKRHGGTSGEPDKPITAPERVYDRNTKKLEPVK